MSATWCNVLMLFLVLAALILAYYQFGSRADIRRIHYDLELLRARQKEFVESMVEAVAVAYDQSRKGLQEARDNLHELQEQAVEGLEQQIRRAREQLDPLAQRLEEKAKAAREVTLQTAQAMERAIGVRVRRIVARASLLRVKAKAARAVSATKKKDFGRAEGLLAEAEDLLRNIQGNLGSDRVYDKSLNRVKEAVQAAASAVRSDSQTIQQKLENVLSEADRLVASFESDESKADKQ